MVKREWKLPAESGYVVTDEREVEELADCAEKGFWEQVRGGNDDPCWTASTGDVLVMASAGELTVYRVEKVLDIGWTPPKEEVAE